MSSGGSAGKSQQKSGANQFIDPSQAPFLEQLRNQSQGLASQQLQQGSDFQEGVNQPAIGAFQSFLTPQENPFLQGQIEQGQRGIAENLRENLLPSIGDQAQSGGARGGARQGVAEGIALRDANRTSADFAQNLIGQDFQGQQNRALGALTQAGSIGGLAFSPLQNLAQILGSPTVLSKAGSKGSAAKIGK